ncbi:MAG TPA: hypothetical protein VFK70_04225, partial [Vicinamibacteria bacterium]|nr:hypothetical protein [Vicinamibacteria bacterium]
LGLGLARGAGRRTVDAGRIRRWMMAGAALAGAFAVSSLFRAPALEYASEPVVQRDTGEWLAARYPLDTRIMSGAFCVGFYFYDAGHAGNERPLPWGDAGEVLDLARRQAATLLVVPQWHLRNVAHPAADVLLHPERPYPGLRPLASLGDDARGRIFVYEVQPSPGPPAAPP